MRRREFLQSTASGWGALALHQQDAWAELREESDLSIVNAAEHAWVVDNPRFPMNARYSNCPNSRPQRNYSRQHLLAEMKVHDVDKVVISQVCYYGTDNSYTIHCVRSDPDRFAGIGLLVGHRLHRPGDPLNPMRLESLMEAGLAGLRLSPIYDPETTWLNDPVSYPLWKKAQELGAVFNIFLKPHQLGQVADMARRFPEVKVVIDHFAMIDIGRPDEEGIDLILALQPLNNVYVRTSLHNPSKQGLPFRDMWPYLRRIYDVFGPRRMIYANFYELLIIKDLIPFFNAEDKAWILGKTARDAYSLSATEKR